MVSVRFGTSSIREVLHVLCRRNNQTTLLPVPRKEMFLSPRFWVTCDQVRPRSLSATTREEKEREPGYEVAYHVGYDET